MKKSGTLTSRMPECSHSWTCSAKAPSLVSIVGSHLSCGSVRSMLSVSTGVASAAKVIASARCPRRRQPAPSLRPADGKRQPVEHDQNEEEKRVLQRALERLGDTHVRNRGDTHRVAQHARGGHQQPERESWSTGSPATPIGLKQPGRRVRGGARLELGQRAVAARPDAGAGSAVSSRSGLTSALTDVGRPGSQTCPWTPRRRVQIGFNGVSLKPTSCRRTRRRSVLGNVALDGCDRASDWLHGVCKKFLQYGIRPRGTTHRQPETLL